MFSKISTLILFFVFSYGLLGCQSSPKDDYNNMILQASKSQKSYAGFHQTFEATITPLSRPIMLGVLERKGEVLGWTPERLEREKQDSNEKRLTHSKFFVRFYSPNQDYDDLHKPNSIWKIYLIVGNQKYEGEVKKDFSKLIELQAMYPKFDRFSTGYEVSFPIGQASLENESYSVLLTSSLGKAEFNF